MRLPEIGYNIKKKSKLRIWGCKSEKERIWSHLKFRCKIGEATRLICTARLIRECSSLRIEFWRLPKVIQWADFCLRKLAAYIENPASKFRTLRGQTLHWIGAQFGVCRPVECRDKYLNIFQNASGLHIQNFRGFYVQIPVSQFLSAHLFSQIPELTNVASCSGFHNGKQIPQKERRFHNFKSNSQNLKSIPKFERSPQNLSEFCIFVIELNWTSSCV